MVNVSYKARKILLALDERGRARVQESLSELFEGYFALSDIL
jgi:hypothetical protein